MASLPSIVILEIDTFELVMFITLALRFVFAIKVVEAVPSSVTGFERIRVEFIKQLPAVVMITC